MLQKHAAFQATIFSSGGRSRLHDGERPARGIGPLGLPVDEALAAFGRGSGRIRAVSIAPAAHKHNRTPEVQWTIDGREVEERAMSATPMGNLSPETTKPKRNRRGPDEKTKRGGSLSTHEAVGAGGGSRGAAAAALG
jgi:hypothetical protein